MRTKHSFGGVISMAGFTALAFAAFAGNATAQSNEPSKPRSMTEASVPQQFVIGAPKPNDSAAKKKLIYRDPKLPLSIDEMAEIQKQKLVAEALEKAGYTTDRDVVVAEKRAADAAVAAAAKPKVPPKQSVLTVHAVYSVRGDQSGEVSLDGAHVRMVKPGDRITRRVSIAAISTAGLTIQVQPASSARGSCKPSKEKERCTSPQSVTVMVGSNYRWVD